MHSIIPLLQVLDPDIPVQTLSERLDEMLSLGYRCAGLYDGNELVGICGIWILAKYYVGKHIEPDNLFILPAYRGKGLGKKLMAWVYEYGKSQGCIASELNCYVNNQTGQAFWESEAYQAIGLHYQKAL